jgi:outer membrane protein assembly factor BamB
MRLLARGAHSRCASFRLIGTLALALTLPAQDWPQFRGNPPLTGVSQATPPKTPKLLWTHEAGDAIESSAAIVQGVVYLGIGNGEVHAIDLNSGKLRWKYKAAELIGESSPAVGDGVVYIGDLDGVIHAVSAADGERLWTFKTGGEVKASPVVVDGKVLVGSYDGSLYALDAKTGKPVWQVRTKAQVHATTSVANNLAYITGCDGILRALKVSDGSEAYHIEIGSYTGASPAVSGQQAFFGTFNNEVFGVDLAKRKIMWRYEHAERKFPFYSTAAVWQGKVFVGGRDKMLHALDAATGKALWTFTTRSRVDSSPVIADNRVFFGSNDGRLYALDAADGKKVWEFTAGAPISASPAMSGDKIVVAAQDGRVYCFGS